MSATTNEAILSDLLAVLVMLIAIMWIVHFLLRTDECICHKMKDGCSLPECTPPPPPSSSTNSTIDKCAVKKYLPLIESELEALKDRLDAMPAHEFQADEIEYVRCIMERHSKAIAGLMGGTEGARGGQS